MRRIDELHTDFPFAGRRMLRDLLAAVGIKVGRLHVSTLMKKMGVAAIYRRPNTSKPAAFRSVMKPAGALLSNRARLFRLAEPPLSPPDFMRR
jgi:hypothetical protein